MYAALAALSAEDLREVIREIMVELDDRAQAGVLASIIRRASRGGSGWAPAALDDAEVAETEAFIEAAIQDGYADPSDMDDHLRRGIAEFLTRDYGSAQRIFGALLRPIAHGDVDLGQDEMAEEVLGVDLRECAINYVVSIYMTSDPARRAEAVRTAIGEMRDVAYLHEPIREIERAAVEPLPGFRDFLSQWRVMLENVAARDRQSGWDREEDRWRREIIGRLEGSEGLSSLARSTKKTDDLRSWCESLVEARDWKGARAAFEAATNLVTEPAVRAEFLDGAALAAQEMGEKDVSLWLGRAWQAQSTMPRLRRWLGAVRTREAMQKRVTEALQACPEPAQRQRGLLHVLRGDIDDAARLLTEAPGLGWSSPDHPGHLIFPLFQMLLGKRDAFDAAMALIDPGTDFEDDDEPRLPTPEVETILQQAGVGTVSDERVRETLLRAMRAAATKRVAGVTGQKRRSHYGHAASLVAACVAYDESPMSAGWARDLRDAYRRFPAFRAELDGRLRFS